MAPEASLYEVTVIPKCPALRQHLDVGCMILTYDTNPQRAVDKVIRHLAETSTVFSNRNDFDYSVRHRLILD